MYKLVFREAEARQHQAVMEAKAIAQQVEELAHSIALDKENIEQDDRRKALASLIELKRLEQLKAIASSQTNSTYFFGDKAALGKDTESYNIDYAEQIKKNVQDRHVHSNASIL